MDKLGELLPGEAAPTAATQTEGAQTVDAATSPMAAATSPTLPPARTDRSVLTSSLASPTILGDDFKMYVHIILEVSH